MPLIRLICESCKREFEGRPNRRTCSIGCRRSVEFGRRLWDRRAAIVRYYERNTYSEYLTKRQREHWRKKFEAAQAPLGSRP
jgi:hypothetical protein